MPEIFFSLTDSLHVKYEDLLNVPFVYGGRSKYGMDCYGLCIEMSRRNGKPLKDLCFESAQESQNLSDSIEKLNITEIPEKEACAGDLVQCVYEGTLHVAFLIDSKRVIHATFGGVRVSPLLVLKERRFFRVT